MAVICDIAQKLLDSFSSFASSVRIPKSCVYCEGNHIVRNGSAVRTATILQENEVIFLPEITIRRVKCQVCRTSWQLRPPGIMPHRHYQLSVLAEGVESATLKGKTLQTVAEESHCSRWTVSRWLKWLAEISQPSHFLARWTEICGSILPSSHLLLEKDLHPAATTLTWCDLIAHARGAVPPGIQTILEAVLDNRTRYSTYADPKIPEIARRQWGGRLSTILM